MVVAETSPVVCCLRLAVPGASAYYKGGSVLYTYQVRKLLLGIKGADVEGLICMLSHEWNPQMAFANKARAQFGATWAIAELGIAGQRASFMAMQAQVLSASPDPTRCRHCLKPGLLTVKPTCGGSPNTGLLFCIKR